MSSVQFVATLIRIVAHPTIFRFVRKLSSDGDAMSRIIREHTIYGFPLIINAPTEEEARLIALEGRMSSHHCWEIIKIEDGVWECYLARHEDCFALND
jgi:hypothetical protein